MQNKYEFHYSKEIRERIQRGIVDKSEYHKVKVYDFNKKAHDSAKEAKKEIKKDKVPMSLHAEIRQLMKDNFLNLKDDIEVTGALIQAEREKNERLAFLLLCQLWKLHNVDIKPNQEYAKI
jgi:hypothetical protein